MVTAARTRRALVGTGTMGACALAVHTAINLRRLRTPMPPDAPLAERVDVLVPARNEANHIEATVASILAQVDVPGLRVLVLDDGSTDDTAARVERLARNDARVQLILGGDVDPPAGWLGKPWACARLGDLAEAPVLVFVDADVLLLPDALSSAVTTLRAHGFALVAPYPFQVAETWLERLIQPLVTWSWIATLPLRWAEESSRPSLSAANGQLLVLDADAYRSIGGHAAVRSDVLEDVALMRALKAGGHRTATVDGTTLAQCRMYESAPAVVDGYAKSLWNAFGGAGGSIAVNAALLTMYVAPATAMVLARDRRTRALGALGYAAGVASRALVARRTGERVLPDTMMQPASIAAFAALNAVSWHRHRRGANTWKGRPVTAQVQG